MELKSILNRVYQLPGFVYGRIRLLRAGAEGGRDRWEVEVRPRTNGPNFGRLESKIFQ